MEIASGSFISNDAFLFLEIVYIDRRACIYIVSTTKIKPRIGHDSMASACQKYWAGATRGELDR